jgi:hypothetical protein
MGNGAWGMGHGALGIGHGGKIPLTLSPCQESPPVKKVPLSRKSLLKSNFFDIFICLFSNIGKFTSW